MTGNRFLSKAFVALQSGVAMSALALSTPAWAQETTSAEQSDEAEAARIAKDEIVVTGTQIRGIDPVGAPVIGVNREAVLATGASSVNQLLTTIPQIGSFNEVPIIGNGGASSQMPVIRPRIRNIGGNDAGASATLILIDGHRVVGAGLRQTSADPDIVPPGALERMEVIPDGGSSIYGADAVAGVINFITRRRFDGFQIEGRYGFADNYYQVDASATVGKSWDTGSAYVSYNFAKTDDILGGDRDYVRRFDYANNRAPDLTCNPGNIQVGSTIYALPGRTTDPRNNGNRCDTTDLSTAFPKTLRHSVFGAVSQDFGDSVKLDIRAFFTRRVSTMNGGPAMTGNAAFPDTNPYFQTIGGEKSQQVSFSWLPVTGASFSTDRSELNEWGITPTLTWDIGDNWQFRGMFNYGESITTVKSRSLNPTLLQAALRGQNPDNTAQTGIQYAINAYDIAATQNKDLLARIMNWQNFAQNKQKLLNVRGIIDGKVLSWFGGDIRLAAGAEFIRESVAPRSGSGLPGSEATIPLRLKAHRDVKAVFGELFVPFIGSDNNAMFHSLSLSLSGRYDNYSDVGSTFNPRVAVTFEPVDWLKIRGSWGTSFNAPSLADTIGSPDGGIGVLSQAYTAFLSNPDSPMNPARGTNQVIVNTSGAFPGVTPQSAKTFSVGFDAKWPFAPGLTTSLTYWNVDFKDQISLPPVYTGAAFYRQFTNLYCMYPDDNNGAHCPAGLNIKELAKLYPTGLADIQELYDDPATDPVVYILLDARRRNLGRSKVSGLDFSSNYQQPTSWGSIDLSFSMTYELTRDGQAFNGAPFVDALLRDNSRLRASATVGSNIGDHLRAQLTWNHTQGYDLTIQPAFNNQARVDSFNVFNLFARYDVKGENLTKDLAFTLNINNLFDTPPPLLQGYSLASQGFINGNTIGRMIQFGVSKKF